MAAARSRARVRNPAEIRAAQRALRRILDSVELEIQLEFSVGCGGGEFRAKASSCASRTPLVLIRT